MKDAAGSEWREGPDRPTSVLPYARQSIDDEDVQAVTEALRSDWITSGPRVEAFERAVADFVGARYGVAVSSGTAALHAAMHAAAIGPGDEVIVPAMTFAASANAVVFQGGRPVFADVDPERLLLDPEAAEARITPRTRALVGVDYTGHPCDYDRLRKLADEHGLVLIADACHALGGEFDGRKVGTLADLTVFSFHPVKHITTGEGGMVVTERAEYTDRMRSFRNHGIDVGPRARSTSRTWYYEMRGLGYNYRLTDIQCALGMSQLKRLPDLLARRRALATRYRSAFKGEDTVRPLAVSSRVRHAYHLYVVQLYPANPEVNRDAVFSALRVEGIEPNVHYIPVHLHPFYRDRFGTERGLCPVAEAAYQRILSLPLFPAMAEGDVDRVVGALAEATRRPVS